MRIGMPVCKPLRREKRKPKQPHSEHAFQLQKEHHGAVDGHGDGGVGGGRPPTTAPAPGGRVKGSTGGARFGLGA